MKVRALKSFCSATASPAEGDVLEVSPVEGLAWAEAGLVERLPPAVETAAARPAPETAVARKRGR